jgi:Xaa-Pro dipeptidase
VDPRVGAALLIPLAFDYAGRLARAREALARAGAAGLLLVPGANLRYATGLAITPSERLVALLVPAAGEPVLVAPAFERERVEGGIGVPLDLATWADGEDPFALARRALGTGRWLLDPSAPFHVAEELRGRGASLESAGGVCAGLRSRKEPPEIEALARAQELTRETLATLGSRLEPGVSECQAADWILASFASAGAGGWAIVQFGEGSAVPHGEPGGRRLAPEAAVLVDVGAVVEGYHADFTRSWWHGARRPARHAEMAAAVEEAQAAAARIARPDTPAQELDRAARDVLERAGWADRFVHRLGHGVGLEIHEEPYLVEGNDGLLQAGQVVTIEPGAYLAGEFGVRHEDLWVVADVPRRL